MEYIKKMESSSVKKATINYASKHKDKEMNNTYLHVENVDFKID